MSRDVNWAQFVSDARGDLSKDAALGGSALPRWLLRWLLERPAATGMFLGIAAGLFGATDAPIDWRFVLGLGVVFGGGCTLAGFILRRRVRRYLAE